MISPRWLRTLASLVALGATACSPYTRRGPLAPAVAARSVVHDLRSVPALAAVFDRDRGHPRIVLLLSPT